MPPGQAAVLGILLREGVSRADRWVRRFVELATFNTEVTKGEESGTVVGTPGARIRFSISRQHRLRSVSCKGYVRMKEPEHCGRAVGGHPLRGSQHSGGRTIHDKTMATLGASCPWGCGHPTAEVPRPELPRSLIPRSVPLLRQQSRDA